jgi:prepilin-type N-terminal cleavage/methylation domain-containing protein
MRQRAFTLVELLIVVLLFGIFAASLVEPSSEPEVERELDVAAQAVAQALRHARSEAIRTASERGVEVDRSAERVRVAEVLFGGGAATLGAVVPDPLTKHPYDFVVAELPGAGGVVIGDALPFEYAGTSKRDLVLFDADGHPFMAVGTSRHVLIGGVIGLESSGRSRSVLLSPVGRVTVQ